MPNDELNLHPPPPLKSDDSGDQRPYLENWIRDENFMF